MFTILAHMPRVEFVNLSLNRLSGPVELPLECGMSRLRNLVLNNTRLDWESVDNLISRLPSLEELHLSLNDYRNVLIDTLDDDVFYESDKEENSVAEANTAKPNHNDVCSSCGSETSPSRLTTNRSMLFILIYIIIFCIYDCI